MDRTDSMSGRVQTMENHDIYKLFGFQQSGSIENSERMEDFNEEDIWGISNDPENKQVGFQENCCNGVTQCRSMGKEGNSNNRKRSEKIPRKESCHEENIGGRMTRYQSSAPVAIPDWSHGITDDNGDDEDNDGRERIPPHELIARQLTQSELNSFSVYEGVGRNLQRRDLSRV